MPNLLVSFLQRSRIKALLMEIKWDFEASPLDRLARILVCAQSFRLELIDTDESLKIIVNDPFAQVHDRLMQTYVQFVDGRNQVLIRTKHIVNQSNRMGMPVPEIIQTRAVESRRSLEIWMATIGSAISKNGRAHGAHIWNKLRASQPQVPAALQQLRKLEEDFGHRMFDASDDEILRACTYIPLAYTTA